MSILWCVVVVAAVCVSSCSASVFRSKSEILQEVALIEDEKMIDTNVCSRAVLSLFYSTIRSDDGNKQNCDNTVNQALLNQQPMLEEVCKCASLVADAIHNVYDETYNCVIANGVWNIREVSKMCAIPEPRVEPPSKPQLSACEEGVSCVHGKCVESVCVCDTNGTRWTGPDCSRHWCPEDCSGNGFCDMGTGLCVCDGLHEGDACETQSAATADTALPLSGDVSTANVTIPSYTPKPIQGICWEALADANAAGQPEDRDIPVCDNNGSWIPLQCNFLRKLCWCVNELGVRYEDTVLPSDLPPSCEGFTGAAITPLTFNFTAPVPIRTSDKCALLTCGPNGYCDASSGTAKCVCLGGFRGPQCLSTATPTPTPKTRSPPKPSKPSKPANFL